MKDANNIFKSIRRLMKSALLSIALIIALMLIFFTFRQWPELQNEEKNTVIPASAVENLPGEIGSIDQESGLVIDHGLTVVKAHCSTCHSAKLVAQNHFSREGWLEVIRWMQEKQNLWDLGEQEKVILDYLEKNYAPNKVGKRKKLENIDWYVLNE